MIRLVIAGLERSLDIKDGTATILNIENQSVFQKVIDGIYQSCTGKRNDVFVLDGLNNRIHLDKQGEVVFFPRLLDFKSKKITTALLAKIKKKLSSDMESQVELDSAVTNLIASFKKAIDEIELPLIMGEEIDVTGIFKFLNIMIEYDDVTNYSIMESYIRVCSELGINKYLFCINFRTIFTEQELKALEEISIGLDIKLILVDNIQTCFIVNDIEEGLSMDSDFLLHTENKSKQKFDYVFD